MSKKIALFMALSMVLVSLSGCLGRGGGKDDGDKNMGSPEEVNPDDYNVLYIGHSFGRLFAQTLEDYAHTAPAFSEHSQFIDRMSENGTASGVSPDALCRRRTPQEHQQSYLDTGEIDVLIANLERNQFEFIEGGLQWMKQYGISLIMQ